MLIDCGEASESSKVISYLNNLGVSRLDYVVATHPHSDHMGGMSEIVSNYDIGELIMPHLPDSDIPTTKYFEKFLDACEAKNLSVTEAQVGQYITIGEAQAEIIAPNSEKYSNTNNYSVGIILTHGSNSFLFAGDAETLAENEMISGGKLRHVTVYKAGHHGSDTSSSENFLKAISPDYAVIMCGEGNSYGHPKQITLDNLSKYVKQIYRTDLNGSIVFESDGTALEIRTEK
jgi:competence protein ComEC